MLAALLYTSAHSNGIVNFHFINSTKELLLCDALGTLDMVPVPGGTWVQFSVYSTRVQIDKTSEVAL